MRENHSLGSPKKSYSNRCQSRKTNCCDCVRRWGNGFLPTIISKLFNVGKSDNLDAEVVCLFHKPRIDILDSHNNFEALLGGVEDVSDVELIIGHDDLHLALLYDEGPGVETQTIIQRHCDH